MISYNCLLCEAIAFFSTGKRNGAIQVKREENNFDENETKIRYKIKLISINQLEDIIDIWNSMRDISCNRFYHRNWKYVVQAVCTPFKLNPFLLYFHKISLEASTNSSVYTIYDATIQGLQGQGKVVHSNTTQPILTIKVNSTSTRGEREVEVINAIFNQKDSNRNSLFHVLSCSIFSGKKA